MCMQVSLLGETAVIDAFYTTNMYVYSSQGQMSPLCLHYCKVKNIATSTRMQQRYSVH